MAQDTLLRAATAASDGDLDRLREIIAASPSVLTRRDENGRTLLDLACRAATGGIAIPLVPGTAAQHAAVDMVLGAGADPSAADNDGWTPLHTAGMAGHVDLARRLVAAGASVRAEAYGKEGGSPLAYALFYAKAYMGDVLEPAHPDNLRTAAALGRDLGRFVIGERRPIAGSGTSLALGTGAGRLRRADSGPRPRRPTTEQTPPVATVPSAFAPWMDLTDAAYTGLDFYAPVFFPDLQRTRSRQVVIDEALTWASRNDQCNAMASLVDLGADVNANAFRGTALLWACYADKVDAVRWLLDHGADPDLRHDWGGEGHGVAAVAMHLAAQNNCVDCVRLLLERGADPDIVDGAYGGTPAGWAEFGGADDTLKILRETAGR